MKIEKSFKERIKALAKNSESYNELVELIKNMTSSNKSVLDDDEFPESSFFEGYFWSVTDYTNNNYANYSSNVESITGYSSGELNELPGWLFSLIIDDDIESTKREYTKFLTDKDKKYLQLTFRITTKDGRIIWICENYRAHRTKKGKITIVETISNDVSEYMNSLNELESRNEMTEELLHEKDKFISIISHDLRSPFTSLLGFSEILLKQSDISTDESQEYITYIHEASKTQLQFINNLLDWSRLQMGKIKLEPSRVRLIDVISNS